MTSPRREGGISEAIGFILILAAIVFALSLYLLYIMPATGREDEIATMSEVKDRLAEYKVDIDTLWTSRQCTTAYGPALSIGAGEPGGILSFIPFFPSRKSYPVLALNHRDEYITISSDSYYTAATGGYNETFILTDFPTNINVNTPPSQVYIILSPNDLTMEKGVWIEGPTWSAWVNVTPRYLNVSRFNMTVDSEGYVQGTEFRFDSLLAGTDITVNTFRDQVLQVVYLPVYQNISVSGVYPVDLMNPAYGISAELQDPQALQAWTSNATLNASYWGEYGYISRVSTETLPMGSLEFRSNNYYYVPQTYYYQLGGVFLEQDDGATMEVPPSISISHVNGSTSVNIGRIQLLGSLLATTMVGSGPITMATAVTDIQKTPYAPGANTRWVNLSIRASDEATARMWNRTLYQIASQGSLPTSLYTLGTAGNVAYMNITGNPQLYDIQLAVTHVNVSGDYLEDNPPGGVTRSWRSLESYRSLPPPVIWTTPPVTTFSPPIPPSPPASGANPPWSCGWGNRRNITINKTAVAGPLTNFPVLINITSDSGLMNNARSDGWDIYFTDSTGTTRIPYEREYFNKGSGDLIAWVQVPSVTNTRNTTIYLYYNSSVSEDLQSPQEVWDSSYRGVWHLNETSITGSTDEVRDSTSYNNDGTGEPGTPLPTGGVTGKIRNAMSFPTGDAAGGAYVDLGTPSSLQITGDLTIEAWAKPDVTGSHMGMAGKLTDSYAGYTIAVSELNYYHMVIGHGTETVVNSNSAHTDLDWHHIAGVVSGGTDYLYVNGVQQTSVLSGSITDSGGIAYIGREYSNLNYRYWDGLIDEVRISATARSANWIATGYTNQDKPQLFAYLMPEEVTPTCPLLLQSKTASSRDTDSISLTLDSPVGPGNLTAVSFVAGPQSLSVISVTDTQGNLYTLAQGPDAISTWGDLYTYYTANTNPGTTTITVQFSETADFSDAFAAEFSGLATSSPLDVTSAGTGTTTAINSGSRMTTRDKELVYGFAATDSSASPVSPNILISNLEGHFTSYSVVFAPYFYNVSGTNSAGSWTCQMATFRAV